MRIGEFSEREDFDAIFLSTAQRLLGERVPDIRLHMPPRSGNPTWRCQSLASFIFCERPSRTVARFVGDAFKHTPFKRRRPFQYLVGRAFQEPAALVALSRPMFSATHEVPHQQDLLFLAGNRRVRLFDFDEGTCHVTTKVGFSNRALEREVAVRTTDEAGASAFIAQLTPVSTEDGQIRGFVEEILDGVSLPRVEPGRRHGATADAFIALHEWTESTHKTTGYLELTRVKLDEIVALLDEFLPPFPAQLRLRDRLQLLSLGMLSWLVNQEVDEVQTARAHGDFQPGNVLLGPTGKLTIIDWEHAEERVWYYDLLTWILGLRRSKGRRDRMREFLNMGVSPFDLGPFDSKWKKSFASRAAREHALVTMLIDEYLFYLREAVAGPYRQPPASLSLFLDDAEAFADLLSVKTGAV